MENKYLLSRFVGITRQQVERAPVLMEDACSNWRRKMQRKRKWKPLSVMSAHLNGSWVAIYLEGGVTWRIPALIGGFLYLSCEESDLVSKYSQNTLILGGWLELTPIFCLRHLLISREIHCLLSDVWPEKSAKKALQCFDCSWNSAISSNVDGLCPTSINATAFFSSHLY